MAGTPQVAIPTGMRASASFILSDGNEVVLYPGDLLGRSRAAALRLDDIRVSEAHAMVSVRGGELRLLALRGLLAVDRKPLTEVALEPGMVIQLAQGISLGVSNVTLPEHVLAIEGDGLKRAPLEGHSASLMLHPEPRVLKGYADDAAAYLWSHGEGWCVRVGDADLIELDDGTEWIVDGRTFRSVQVPVGSVGAASTLLRGRLHSPLRIVVSFDTAALHRDGHPALGLGGMSARIMSELVALDGPAHWSLIAQPIWRDLDESQLRRRWDKNIARLRKKLRDANVRPDLVRADGTGQFELLLYAGDEIVDRT